MELDKLDSIWLFSDSSRELAGKKRLSCPWWPLKDDLPAV